MSVEHRASDINKDTVFVHPIPIDGDPRIEKVSEIDVVYPNDGLRPRDRLVSTVFTRDRDRHFMPSEPRLVVRKMFKVDVIEDSIRCILIEVVHVEQAVKITVTPERTGPMRFTRAGRAGQDEGLRPACKARR